MSVDKINASKKIALKLHNAKIGVDSKIHNLTYLFWESTLRCNLSCVHCGSDCTKSTEQPDMPKEHFLQILDQIESFVDKRDFVVAITGGEPLMRNDLLDICQDIKRRGFRWGLVTNGYSLTSIMIKRLLEAGLSSIAISLDGLEEDHNWFRGNSLSFKRAIQAIKNTSLFAKENHFLFDVVTCVNKKNISDLEEIRDLLVSLNVKRWRIGTVFPKGRAKENPHLKVSGKQLKEVLEFIANTRAEGTINISYGCESFLGNYEFQVRDLPFYCKAGINIGSVLADGSISACPSLRGDYIQGNIYQDDFIDVWNNRYQIMRNRKWTKTGVCDSCDVWKYCKGNSLHLRDEKSGDLLYCSYEELKI